MLLVALGWGYVVVMMAIAEATSPQGTVLGAVITFALYGVLPLAIVLYLMATPARRRARRAAETAEISADSGAAANSDGSVEPDSRGHAAGDAVAPVRKEP
jgi:uncharacterized membrane protein